MTATRDDGDTRGGVTLRAVLLSFALLALLTPVVFYVELAWNKAQFFVGVPAMAPVVVLFALTGAMSLPFFRRAGLTRRELLVVYVILLVAGPIISHSVMVWMLCKTVSYYYMGRADVSWQAVFLKEVPAWFAPTDRKAIEGFFEGHAGVPWALWAWPLAAWGAFMLCTFLSSFCVIALVQRQWVGGERLSFPFAQIPLEIVREAPSSRGEGVARLPVRAAFWFGLGVSFAIAFVNGLSTRYPSVPAIPLGPVPIMQWQRVGPLAGLGEIDLVLWPWMIAIAYLVPKELSFSTWFFWLANVALTVAAIAAGATPERPEEWFGSTFPAPRYQGGGAVLALAVWALWIARGHLAHALKAAVGRSGEAADRDEPLPYRWAAIGLAIAFAGMVYFGWAAGCRLLVSLILMGSIIAYYVMWAKLRAETGMGFLPFPLEIQNAMVVPLGTAAFTVREYITMMSTRWAFFPGFNLSYEVCTGTALESLKIADAAGINRRRLTAAMAAGVALAMVMAGAYFLTGIYRHGFFGLSAATTYSWLGHQSMNDGYRITEPLMNPQGTDANGLIAMVAGAAVAVFLGMMRLRFWWWPFHPIGYMAAMCWGLHWYYMPFFVGWALKTLVIRYGGLRLYRATVPVAVGVILGDMLNSGLWAVVALVTQGRV